MTQLILALAATISSPAQPITNNLDAGIRQAIVTLDNGQEIAGRIESADEEQVVIAVTSASTTLRYAIDRHQVKCIAKQIVDTRADSQGTSMAAQAHAALFGAK